MEKFQRLGLSQPILELLDKSGIREPSEIQEKAIPLVLEGKDVIGDSATGSGKTLAFGAGIIEHTEKGKGPQVLILTPTRELAEQIGAVFRKYSSYKRLNIAMVYGGVSIDPQIFELKHADIVVGTPGRILDHLNRGTIDLSKVKTLVLDEADRMLDMGFIDDVEKIIYQCPPKRQTLLFSATISPDIDEIAKKHMKSPKKVSAEDYVDPEKLRQFYYDVQPNMKFSLLVHLLKDEKSGLVMVFCNTRKNTEFIAENLKRNGINALGIHGGLTQSKRDKVMKSFNSKKTYVLVCTDVAARGLDIKGVSHVYNYDSPKTSKDYIHRIGRTARAGKEGKVINIVSNRDYENFQNVMEDESLKIQMLETPEIKKIFINRNPRSSGRNFNRRENYANGRRDSGREHGRNYGGERHYQGSKSIIAYHRF